MGVPHAAAPVQLSDPPPQLLRSILDGLPAMVGYWDRDERNRLANAAYTEWFGLTPEQIHGMAMRDVLGADLYAQNVPHIRAALDGERQEFDRAITSGDGCRRHVQATYVPDVADGEVRGFFALVTEVTARVESARATEEAAERYRALIRSLPAGFVLLFDGDLRYTIADGSALEAFGWTRAALEGRRMPDALGPDLAAELEPRYLRALAGEQTTWERTHERRVYRLTAGPVRDAEQHVAGGIVVCTDVTEERRGAAIARALSALSSVAAEGASLDELAQRVAQTLRELFELDHVGLMRVRDRRWARAVAADPPPATLDPAFAEEIDLEDSSMALAEAVRTGEPAVHRYTAQCKGEGARRLYAAGQRIGASAPIFVRGELWGALSVTSADPDAIGEAIVDQLVSVGELVGLAIANAEAWEALRAEATTDPITGLANHRVYQERLAQALGELRRDGRGFGLVILDLDHFKSVNDTHGHPAGDAVLRETGRRLAAVARGHELAARVGGEEFALVIGGTDADGAMAVAERACRAIADEPFEGVGRLTASAGVAVAGPAERLASTGALIDAADRALYAAKRAGRARVIGPGGQQAEAAAPSRRRRR